MIQNLMSGLIVVCHALFLQDWLSPNGTASNAKGEIEVFLHYSDSISMDGTESRIFEETDQEGLGRFLQS